jgi:hypothetical protein
MLGENIMKEDWCAT